MAQEGTQAIRRAAAVLQRIAHVGDQEPPTLSSISEALGLSRSTVHRILKCLTEEGLAHYDTNSRRYEIGLLSYELGLAVTDRVLQLTPWAAAVDRVAQRSNVTSYLMRRSGMEAVCVHKAEGRAVIRVIPVEVGQRRYLGVGAGATALLAGLADDVVERVISAVSPHLGAFADLTPERIRDAVAHARNTGYAESDGRAYQSIYGLGVAVSTHGSVADIAISIAAHAPEVSQQRKDDWKAIINEEIAETRERIAANARLMA